MAHKYKGRADGEDIGLSERIPFRSASDFLSLSGQDEPIPASSLSEILDRLVRKVGAQPIRFHDLRHTYAALMSRDDTYLQSLMNKEAK
jgi:integrase